MTQANKAFNPLEFGAEMMKAFTKPIDREGMMANHRKNLEALTEANKMAVDVMKSIAQLQTQYLKRTFDDMALMARDSMTGVAPKDQWERHSLKMKEHLHNAIDHGSAIANTLVKSHQEIQDVFKSRVQEGLKAAKDTYAPKPTKH